MNRTKWLRASWGIGIALIIVSVGLSLIEGYDKRAPETITVEIPAGGRVLSDGETIVVFDDNKKELRHYGMKHRRVILQQR
jgi:hypothetical protein